MNRLNHVAIIMDGNGRWGLKKNKSRNYGHLKGLKAVETVIKSSINKKIPYLTLYTFSTENWKRPEQEIDFLFSLVRKHIKKNLKRITKQGIKVNIIGRKKNLPKDIVKSLKLIKEKTFQNDTITVNLALNYGSKEEIVNALVFYNKDKPAQDYNQSMVFGVLENRNIIVKTVLKIPTIYYFIFNK